MHLWIEYAKSFIPQGPDLKTVSTNSENIKHNCKYLNEHIV